MQLITKSILVLCCALSFSFQTSPTYSKVKVGHAENRGLGWNTGFTHLQNLSFYDLDDSSVVYTGLNGFLFNDFKGGGNVNLGYRVALDESCRTFGTNFNYDCRSVCGGFFNQLGFGVEYLSHEFDVRLNGYLPVGDKNSLCLKNKCTYPGGYYVKRYFERRALRGIDFEVGKQLLADTDYGFYFAVGGYYYKDPNSSNFTGARVRLDKKYQDFGFSIESTYDKHHGTLVFGEVYLDFPVVGSILESVCPLLYQDPYRNPIIVKGSKRTLWDYNY